MKSVLISGYYGFGNFGDELILVILINKLKAMGAKVTVLSVDPEKTGSRNNVDSINSFEIKLISERIKNFDILISGGGSLLQNVTSTQSLFYYGGLIMMAAAINKDVAIFAQGIGPVKGFMAKFILKNVLKKCRYISVRDQKSKAMLDKMGIDSELVCDPVFSLEMPPRKKTNKIGIQIRKYETLTDRLIDDIIDEILKRYPNREYELISFHDLEDVDAEKVFISRLKKKDPNAKVKLVSGLTIPQIIKRVGTYETFIAMRYHACVLSIKYGIKTLAIAYDPKVETLAENARIPFLKMKSKENDYEKSFDQLEALTSFNLLNWANAQKFDWEKTRLAELLDDKLGLEYDAERANAKAAAKEAAKQAKKKKKAKKDEIIIEENND